MFSIEGELYVLTQLGGASEGDINRRTEPHIPAFVLVGLPLSSSLGPNQETSK